MKIDGKENYKNCDIGWSAFGENKSYGSYAWVTIHAEKTIDQKIVGEIDVHPTIEIARNYIINEAKKWIDGEIKSGALKPIK